MPKLSGMAFNLFESIGLATPRVEVTIREVHDHAGGSEDKPQHQQWITDKDQKGRKVVRLDWAE